MPPKAKTEEEKLARIRAAKAKYKATHPNKDKTYYQRNKDRELLKNLIYRLKQRGFTIEEYNKILKEQNGVCAICGRPPQANKRLAIDHDHVTGKFRGLLCFICNYHITGFIDRHKINPEKIKEYYAKAVSCDGKEI